MQYQQRTNNPGGINQLDKESPLGYPHDWLFEKCYSEHFNP